MRPRVYRENEEGRVMAAEDKEHKRYQYLPFALSAVEGPEHGYPNTLLEVPFES